MPGTPGRTEVCVPPRSAARLLPPIQHLCPRSKPTSRATRPGPAPPSNLGSISSSHLLFAGDPLQQCPGPTCSLEAPPPRPSNAPRVRSAHNPQQTPLSPRATVIFFFNPPKSCPKPWRSDESVPVPIQTRLGCLAWQLRSSGSGQPAGGLARRAQRRSAVPVDTPTPPRAHLPFATRGGDGGEGAGSLRRRMAASREESLCHTEQAARGGRGRRWVGAPGGGAACSRLCPSGARQACVPPRSPRPPRSRSLRPVPGALRLQPRRAPAAAAARPPATLPLPLNSCAKYAALHLQGKPSGP